MNYATGAVKSLAPETVQVGAAIGQRAARDVVFRFNRVIPEVAHAHQDDCYSDARRPDWLACVGRSALIYRHSNERSP